jgi:hypothetical protein
MYALKLVGSVLNLNPRSLASVGEQVMGVVDKDRRVSFHYANTCQCKTTDNTKTESNLLARDQRNLSQRFQTQLREGKFPVRPQSRLSRQISSNFLLRLQVVGIACGITC